MNDATRETVRVLKGMILLQRDEHPGLPTRHRLWTVKSVREKSVDLIAYDTDCLMEATARFPDGVVRLPWKVLALSARDLAYVWEKLPPSSTASSPAGVPGVPETGETK